MSTYLPGMGLAATIDVVLWYPRARSDRAELGAWKSNCAAPFLTQGEEKTFLLAFMVVKSGW